MPTANGRKGAEAERMVAKYFRDQGFWMADRRLREGRNDDQGDIDGVPFTTIQVKYVEANRYAAWTLDTLKQRERAGTPLCMLVRRVPRKPVEQWEASLPSSYFMASFEYMDGGAIDGQPDEAEAWTWMRMDLRLAVVALRRMTDALSSLSARSLPSTSRTSITPAPVTRASSSALSMGKDTPASPTT